MAAMDNMPSSTKPRASSSPEKQISRDSALKTIFPEDLDTDNGCDLDSLRDHPDWSYWRILCARLLGAHKFEIGMGLITLSNIIPIIMETDAVVECDNKSTSECDQSLVVLKIVNNLFLLIYSLELLARLFLFRKRFHLILWNNFDAAIVAIGIAGEIAAGMLPRLAALRIFRVARLVRLVRLFISFRELYLIVSGVLSVAKTMFWAAILLVLLLCVLSILAVEYLNPANKELLKEGHYSNCDWCGRAFTTVWSSNITLFLFVIVGDAWGLVAVPLMEKTPLATVILLACVLIVSLGFSNLIMSVIVEKAIESRNEDEQYVLVLQAREDERLKTRFMSFCHELDTDNSGQISLEELLSNCKKNRHFASALRSMRIEDEADLKLCFQVMDVDRSGSVSYEEFGNAILRMKTTNLQSHMLFLEHHLSTLVHDVQTMQREMRDEFIIFRKRADDLVENMSSQAHACKADIKPESDNQGIPAQLQPPVGFTSTVQGELDDVFQCVKSRMSQIMDSITREASAQEQAMAKNVVLLNNLSDLVSPFVAKATPDATNLPLVSPSTPIAAKPVTFGPEKCETAWDLGKATTPGRGDGGNMRNAPPVASVINSGCNVRTREASHSLRACGCGQ